MLKILQARLQQYVNHELPGVQAGSSKKKEFQKDIYFCFIDYANAFDCVVTINCGKFFKRWEYQTTSPAP